LKLDSGRLKQEAMKNPNLIKRLTELKNEFRVQVLKRLISVGVSLFMSRSVVLFGPVKYPSPCCAAGNLMSVFQ
jgi:hypothetical protein